MLESGRRKLAAGEWEEARAAFVASLSDDPDSAEALEGLGWALYWLDEPEESLDKREAAYRRFLRRGDMQSAARVAIGIAVDSSDIRGMAVSTGWLRRARTHLADLELTPEHGWVALWEGHLARGEEHDLERALELASEARSVARTLNLPELESLVNALEGLIKVTEGDVRGGMRQLDEAAVAALAGELTDLDSVVATCCFLVHACERVRDYDRAAQWGDRIEALATRWRIRSLFALCQAEHASMLIGRGEWEEAERELLASLTTLESKRPLVIDEALVQLADLRRRQGRIDEALEIYGRAESNTLSLLGLAAVALDRGEPERCANLVERHRRRSLAEKWVERATALELLVRARGDLEALEELRGVARKVGTAIIRAITAVAEAAAAEGLEERRRWLEDAVDLYERAHAPWDAARARLELATVLRESGREAFAREELVAARDVFRRLGAAADAERAEALLNEVVPQSRRGEGVLSKREIEVLKLVSEGLSNKEVALRLHLSEHTIHRHVSNILGKLGTRSRSAAVAEATREGWL